MTSSRLSAACDDVDEASAESMICSDPPEAGGLHAGPPATEVARSLAYGSGAGWTPLRVALMVGGIVVGAAIVAGWMHRSWA